MNLNELIQYCKVKAIEKALIPDEESTWKSLTRAYSKRFRVPLYLVRQMAPEEVISEIIEDNYDERDITEDLENILDQIYTMEDPSYAAAKKVDMDAFAAAAAEREKKRVERDQWLTEKRAEALAPTKGKGGVDFSNLNEDNEK